MISVQEQLDILNYGTLLVLVFMPVIHCGERSGEECTT